MTNEKALILNTVCTEIEKEYFKLDTKFDIPKPLFYAVARNISKTKVVVADKKELDDTIIKDFKKDIDFDEEKAKTDTEYENKVNADYREYLQTKEIKEQIELFFKAESNVDTYKVKKEVLEDVVIPSSFLEILEELIVE